MASKRFSRVLRLARVRLPCAIWDTTQAHADTGHPIVGCRACLSRVLDETRYKISVVCSESANIRPVADHAYEISRLDGGLLEAVFAFSPTEVAMPLPTFDAVREASARHWAQFWRSGGAIDLSACDDPRAGELEWRVVLSLPGERAQLPIAPLRGAAPAATLPAWQRRAAHRGGDDGRWLGWMSRVPGTGFPR